MHNKDTNLPPYGARSRKTRECGRRSREGTQKQGKTGRQEALEAGGIRGILKGGSQNRETGHGNKLGRKAGYVFTV